jgi:serine protease Do
MKSLTKKICAVIVSIALIAVTAFSGCSLLSATWGDTTDSGSGTSIENVTEKVIEESNEDKVYKDLMTTREKIRAFNIYIVSTYTYTTTSGFMGHWQTTTTTLGQSLGSGVIIEEDDTYYYALTNNHVITTTFTVTDSMGRTQTYTDCTVTYSVTDINGVTYTAELLAYDNDDNDIALISFPKKTGAAQLGKADYTTRLENNVVSGEFVLAVGNPSGVKYVVTYGMIIDYDNIANVSYDVINHNALINPGNSGGALCDKDGNLLGLNTWGESNSDSNNYAIPLSVINTFLSEVQSLYAQTDEAA